MDAFFHVFGRQRRHVASYEQPVKILSGDWGFIDLFWPKTLLAEHKSAGKDLGKAHAQGMEYIRGLVDSGRGKEVPRYLSVSDFKHIATHDLEPESDPDAPLFQRLPPSFEFPLADFPSDRTRVEYLFQLYEQLTAPLAPSTTAKPKRPPKTPAA